MITVSIDKKISDHARFFLIDRLRPYFPGEHFTIICEEKEEVKVAPEFVVINAMKDSTKFREAVEKHIAEHKKGVSNDMKTKSTLQVSIEVAGAHHYPESVRSYLKQIHRHDFRVSVSIGVTDQNRQFEFYDVQDMLRKALDSLFVKIDRSTYNFGTRSCEHIANELLVNLSEIYPVESVSVYEDQYNGATVRPDGCYPKPVFMNGGKVNVF